MQFTSEKLPDTIKCRWLVCSFLLLFTSSFSGCTYVKGLVYSYDFHKNKGYQVQEPPVYLRWVTLGRHSPNYWIPPLATVGWDKGNFRISISFAGDSIEATDPAFILEDFTLYEVVGVFANDTTIVYTSNNNLQFSKEKYARSVSYETDYFLPIKKPKHRNLILKMKYSLTAKNGEIQHFTLRAPLAKKRISEFTLFGLVIENKHKVK